MILIQTTAASVLGTQMQQSAVNYQTRKDEIRERNHRRRLECIIHCHQMFCLWAGPSISLKQVNHINHMLFTIINRLRVLRYAAYPFI